MKRMLWLAERAEAGQRQRKLRAEFASIYQKLCRQSPDFRKLVTLKEKMQK